MVLPDRTDIWRSRTTLAIAFDYLMAAGIPSQVASKKIEDATEDPDDQAFTPMSALFSSWKAWSGMLEDRGYEKRRESHTGQRKFARIVVKKQ